MILDSNIIISFLNGDQSSVRQLREWRKEGLPLAISVVTLAEVLSLSTLTQEQIRRYRLFLQTFDLMPLDARTALEAARIRRTYQLPVADAMIAATALVTRNPLITRDKGFSKVAELEIIVP